MEPKSFSPPSDCPITGEPIWQAVHRVYGSSFWHYVIIDTRTHNRHSFSKSQRTTLGFTVEPAAFGADRDIITQEQIGWNDDIWYRRNKHLLFAAFKNGYTLFDKTEEITLSLLRQRLGTTAIPQTSKMTLDWVLKCISDYQESTGTSINFRREQENESITWSIPLHKLYIKDEAELEFYLRTLQYKGLIIIYLDSTLWPTALTFKGLSYLASLEQQGSISKNCFVAMSFSDQRKEYRVAIEIAIKAAGYEPRLIDTQHLDSDKTINDRIIAEIRACKFCVADFTEQRNGIYFEAGFALGLGKPIIYVCEKADFEKNSHFDLKPFQHILYNSAAELQIGLEAKISAWIQ